MRRFLWIWLALLGAWWAARTAISAVAFERADMTVATLVQLVAVPALQAGVVWWMTRAAGGPNLRDVLHAVSSPWLFLFLGWDAAILFLGWLIPENPFFSPLAGIHLGGAHNLLLGLAAGGVVGLTAWRGRWTRRERAWLLLFAGWLPAAGLSFLFPWWDGLPELLLPHLPVELGWTAVFGTFFVLSIGLLLRIDALWHPRSEASAWLLELAVLCALVSAAIAVLSLFLHPSLAAPWDFAARAGLYFAMTALFLAAYRAFPRETSSQPPSPVSD